MNSAIANVARAIVQNSPLPPPQASEVRTYLKALFLLFIGPPPLRTHTHTQTHTHRVPQMPFRAHKPHILCSEKRSAGKM